MKRIFAAVKIIARKPLSDLIQNMKKEMAFHRINWVQPENIHITLKFFGETHENEIPGISKLLSEAASTLSPFTLQLFDTGIFGSHNRNNQRTSYDPYFRPEDKDSQ